MSRVLDVCLVVGCIHTLRLLLGPVLLAFDQNRRLNHYPETLEKKRWGKKKIIFAPCSANAVVKWGGSKQQNYKINMLID